MTSRYRRQFLAIAFCSVALAAPAARADSFAYQKVIDLSAASAALRVEHHHDWSGKTRAARLQMITTDQNPFLATNTYSSLRVLDSKSGAELFRRPVPALTYLWIDPASNYIVGLSKLQIHNPYHVVVFNKSGARLFETSLLGMNWPETFQSTTNWVAWYKEPTPKIELVEGLKTVVLSVEDRAGVMRSFEFPVTRSDETLGAPPLNP